MYRLCTIEQSLQTLGKTKTYSSVLQKYDVEALASETASSIHLYGGVLHGSYFSPNKNFLEISGNAPHSFEGNKEQVKLGFEQICPKSN
jgi:hypothetical protein